MPLKDIEKRNAYQRARWRSVRDGRWDQEKHRRAQDAVKEHEREKVEGRICRKCGERKPLVIDNWRGRGRGFERSCRTCECADATRYYKEHKQPTIDRVREHRRAVRREVIAHYSEGKSVCACCGEGVYEFLTIDHVNGGGTAHRKVVGGSLMGWLRSQGYPPGYQVLCYNCNCAKGIYGECPHTRRET